MNGFLFKVYQSQFLSKWRSYVAIQFGISSDNLPYQVSAYLRSSSLLTRSYEKACLLFLHLSNNLRRRMTCETLHLENPYIHYNEFIEVILSLCTKLLFYFFHLSTLEKPKYIINLAKFLYILLQ